MTQNNTTTAGLGFRVNNPNSGLLGAREPEDSYGATPSTTETPHDQKKDRRPLTKKKREYTTTRWTKGEKAIILECFSYSRHECWGKSKTKNEKLENKEHPETHKWRNPYP